ncbi:MAG: endonuclease/exonuclease/phosphatase family protein [Winogradskyella sp.]|uniref:endonuclease/exonuclease/phosphatase family protein n=1 Tax=Winogradskyella sp. TaxID=1883156 RepID=UPI0025E793D0|nr:endonuclease/exonuclease/phosphatase family protein [Winogradskyella sp.]NRB58597.1 endonuclease/exonuclease/phosphatase family protein [Winogradskyella sp.]
MKKIGIFNKLIFVVNSVAAFLLLLSYILPYIPPKNFALLSVLSLSVPLLIILNILFFVYWLIRVRKQMLLSFLVLLFGWGYINSLYKFSSSKVEVNEDNFSVMSFNVRIFNSYNWLPNDNVRDDIKTFIVKEQPDIICFQEYTRGTPLNIEGYHRFNGRYTKNVKPGHAIFSKFPIINSGSLEFPETTNNAIFIDVVRKSDTIRIYNLHLQSSGIQTDTKALQNDSSERLFKKIGSTFKRQQSQVEQLLAHKAKVSYKTIVTGDFNNTAYSYIYKEILGDDLKDAFEEAGNGFGKTFDFKFFPLRIDFILADKAFKVNGYKTYNDVKLSDHYPIKAILKLN